MGPKQSSPSVGVRVRSYSGSDVFGEDSHAPVLRFYAGGSTGQIGERLPYPSHRTGSFTPSAIIPIGGRREEEHSRGRTLLIGSLPAQLTPHMLGIGFDCPVCKKFVCCDEADSHFPVCFSKPRFHYNEDVLTRDTGECSICLEELLQGDSVARLPCLCVYHRGCIDEWFEVNRSCPEHPTV